MKILKKIIISLFILLLLLAILIISRPYLFCIEVGREIPIYFFDIEFKKCCKGLVPKIDARPVSIKTENIGILGPCSIPMCKCNICLKCGDSICDDFENECNCPEDCKDK